MKKNLVELQVRFRAGGPWRTIDRLDDTPENRDASGALADEKNWLNHLAYRVVAVTEETLYEVQPGQRGDAR